MNKKNKPIPDHVYKEAIIEQGKQLEMELNKPK